MKKSRTAFTLVEIVIAMAIFSVLTFGFYSAMVSIYSNSKTEFYIGKKIFSSVEYLENAVSLLHDQELKSGERLIVSSPDSKKVTKNSIEKDILNLHGDVRYVPKVRVFSSTPYQIDLDGYLVSRQIVVGNTSDNDSAVLTPDQERAVPRDPSPNNYFLYFVPNDLKKELKVPEYEYVKILEKRVPGSASDEGYATDYCYLHRIKKGNTLFAGFHQVEETRPYLYFERYFWDYSHRKNKDGEFFLPYNYVKPAVKPPKDKFKLKAKKGDDYIDGASIFVHPDYPSSRFPAFSSDYESLRLSKQFFKSSRNDILYDGYLRFSLEPIHKSLVKMNILRTDPIWVIALPVTDKLLFHFDFALAQGKIEDSDLEVQEVEKIRDLSRSIHGDWTEDRAFLPISSTDKINVYRDDKFGRFVKLSSSNDIKFDKIRSVDGDDGHYSIFIVVDTESASPGTIFKQLNADNKASLILNYEGGAKFTLNSDYLYKTPPLTVEGDPARDTHIIFMRCYENSREPGFLKMQYKFVVDKAEFKNGLISERIRTKLPEPYTTVIKDAFVVGGASGAKLREIICYKDPANSLFLDETVKIYHWEKKVKQVLEYLERKHLEP